MEFEGTRVSHFRALVVETDRAISELLTELLGILGHETIPTPLEPDQFDLMLVSCSSTDFEGFRSTNPLREKEGLALSKFARANDPMLKINLLAAGPTRLERWTRERD